MSPRHVTSGPVHCSVERYPQATMRSVALVIAYAFDFPTVKFGFLPSFRVLKYLAAESIIELIAIVSSDLLKCNNGSVCFPSYILTFEPNIWSFLITRSQSFLHYTNSSKCLLDLQIYKFVSSLLLLFSINTAIHCLLT